jgi:hypothetical protein
MRHISRKDLQSASVLKGDHREGVMMDADNDKAKYSKGVTFPLPKLKLGDILAGLSG